jgi:hypothetical protein
MLTRGIAIATALLFVANHAGAATVEEETVARVNQLRAVKAGPGAEPLEKYNKQMDEAWKFFSANKAQALPVLRAQLKSELSSPQPNDLVLLDIGYFLYLAREKTDKAMALDALFRVKPDSPVVEADFSELFNFAHLAAADHDPRVLDLIDKAFFSTDLDVIVPQHALTLKATLLCVFLYGAYGPESEARLRTKLKDKATANRALEILVWLGTPASIPDVGPALAASPGYDTFTRVTSYMMQVGGPAGRKFMMSVQAESLDPKAREYYAKIQPMIRDLSFAQMKAVLAKSGGDKRLSDEEVKARLSAMYDNFGKDDRTSPLAIVDSGLSSSYLIGELIKIRSRTLQRLSNEALDDVQVTNVLITALQYR